MVEFDLAGHELALRHGGEVAFPIQMVARVHAVPLARGHMMGHDDAPPMEAARLQAVD